MLMYKIIIFLKFMIKYGGSEILGPRTYTGPQQGMNNVT